MNKLPLEKRSQIVGLLVEGNSLRATTRLAGVSINTVTKLLVDLGMACQKYHDEKSEKENSYSVPGVLAHTVARRTTHQVWT